MVRIPAAAVVSRRQRGLSLVEILISVALGVLLAGGTVSVYLASKRQFLFDDQMARLQENGRYATRLVGRELVHSGFYAGLVPALRPALATVGVDCASSGWALDSAVPLDLVNNHTGSGAPTTVASVSLTCVDGASVVPGSDLLALKRTAARASARQGGPAAGLTPSTVEGWYLKTVAGEAPAWEKHRATDFLGAAVLPVSEAYWEARAGVIFLRTYSQAPGDGTPALCMEVLAGDAMTVRCLVEGVEDMQVEFGVDDNRDGAPERYTSNPTEQQVALSRTARVYLLLRSLRQLPGHRDDLTYYLGEKEILPRADGFVRKVFSTTVRLRNSVELLAGSATP